MIQRVTPDRPWPLFGATRSRATEGAALATAAPVSAICGKVALQATRLSGINNKQVRAKFIVCSSVV